MVPLFPLKIVVFPDEALNLHIFEPRYKQLINDCLDNKSTFVIPAFIHQTIEFGTEVRIKKVNKVYNDGRMDLSTVGLRAVKVREFVNPQEGKLYAGGQVDVLDNVLDASDLQKKTLLDLIKDLFAKINLDLNVVISNNITSFNIAHKIGLSLKQEYKLLSMMRDSDRHDFIISHLNEAIPILQQINEAKERVKMNGHFRHFDPLDF
ncbi:LON peptidase substrate-binding domain-containing protein [Fulvivirgaceae bacterium BMA12]|uniref:LON peptidase substrate-binding domain-containing protein n=1 Tax=Agaribacillus aureus TaxID=3051825 RepID=A0ABT8L3G3_9BACT|nr:LON peptidase substrate-binding domain-containing protein [Fulvivirgaceae bacterium BMA12]